MNFQDIVRSFGAWGYLSAFSVGNLLLNIWKEEGSVFTKAIAAFKDKWGDKYGLPPGDNLDNTTVNLMGRRFCNCPDVPQSLGEGLRHWNGNRITWRDTGVVVGNLSFAAAQAFTIAQTQGVCNMQIVIETIAKTANLMASSRNIDGPGRVLAQAYLPGYPSQITQSLTQEFDSSEAALSQHSFGLVCCHETGHSLGLDHDNTSAIALMDPYLNESLDGWQPADITQLQIRYGPPVSAPPPPPPPPGPTGGKLIMTVTGDNLKYDVATG